MRRERRQPPDDHLRTGQAALAWSSSSGALNANKIDSVCGLPSNRFDPTTLAITASGGICLPVNVDYSVPTWSTADRPLRDGLPQFQANRGGLRFVAPPDIGVPTLQGGVRSHRTPRSAITDSCGL